MIVLWTVFFVAYVLPCALWTLDNLVKLIHTKNISRFLLLQVAAFVPVANIIFSLLGALVDKESVILLYQKDANTVACCNSCDMLIRLHQLESSISRTADWKVRFKGRCPHCEKDRGHYYRTSEQAVDHIPFAPKINIFQTTVKLIFGGFNKETLNANRQKKQKAKLNKQREQLKIAERQHELYNKLHQKKLEDMIDKATEINPEVRDLIKKHYPEGVFKHDK